MTAHRGGGVSACRKMQLRRDIRLQARTQGRQLIIGFLMSRHSERAIVNCSMAYPITTFWRCTFDLTLQVPGKCGVCPRGTPQCSWSRGVPYTALSSKCHWCVVVVRLRKSVGGEWTLVACCLWRHQCVALVKSWWWPMSTRLMLARMNAPRWITSSHRRNLLRHNFMSS